MRKCGKRSRLLLFYIIVDVPAIMLLVAHTPQVKGLQQREHERQLEAVNEEHVRLTEMAKSERHALLAAVGLGRACRGKW